MYPSWGTPLTIGSDLRLCLDRGFGPIFELTGQFKRGSPEGRGTVHDDRTDGAPGAAVTAEGLGLKGPRGWAFRGVTFEAEPGSLIALEGPSGSGRTCLLLALTGRMRATEGHARVGRHQLPEHLAAVRRISGLGPVPGVTDLEPALTVAEHLHERALLERRFGGPLRGLLRRRASGRPRRGRASRPRWPPRSWTWSRCPRGGGPPYATWNGWRPCACPWRWR